MAKKITAKLNIQHGLDDGTVVHLVPGDEVDQAKLGLTKTQLEQLYDAGAIAIEETQEAPASTPTKSAPAKATTSGTSNPA